MTLILPPQGTVEYDRLLLERLYRLRELKLSVSRQALNLYRADPVAFAMDCFRWDAGDGLADYQQETLTVLADNGRVATRGPRGAGKTAPAAIAVHWFALTRDGDDWKIPTTASVWRQLNRFLWPEIHKWSRRVEWSKVRRKPYSTQRELLTLNLKLNTGEAFALASKDPDLIEGAHADHILTVVDEGKAVPDGSWDAMEGYSSSAGEALTLALSTPGPPAGRFYDICRGAVGYEDWKSIHVTIDQAIAAGRISAEWAAQRARQWGEDSPLYRNYVLAEFAGDESSAIPLNWVEAAMARWEDLTDQGALSDNFTCVGVDPADTGEDTSALALRADWHILEVRYPFKAGGEAGTELMANVGRVKGILDARGGYAVVDVIGVGAGVAGRLREKVEKRRVVGFNASERTDWKDSSGELEFVNKRSAAWWNLRELLSPDSDVELALPPDDRLKGDLTAPVWLPVTSSGKVRLESKDDIRKRIGRSTDAGDAVVMAFWEDDRPRPVRRTGRQLAGMSMGAKI